MNCTKFTRRWTRNPCKLISFIILTVVLLIFYLIQMSYFTSFLSFKFWKSMDSDRKVSEFRFLTAKRLSTLFSFQELFQHFKTGFKGEKLIHFDLKGAPPKISYILNLLPFLKKLGATGILLEYEDTFPYHSGLEEIAAKNAYTLVDIAAIIKTAEQNNLTLIPLIPTFGHFEFVLKHERFRKYREVEDNPQSLCPSHEDVYPLLKKMIDQVLEVHNTSKYLHIGCDEVEFLGICPKCQRILREKKWPKDSIYFNHVKKIAEYIIGAYPEVKPILWNDKFTKHNEKIIIQHRIPDLVEVMFWNYQPDENSFPLAQEMLSFAKVFKDIWIANAFKGATGSKKIVTDIYHHLQNTKLWLDFVEEWKENLNFKGIAVTGWQRYNHFMPLCELLPVGIPSLAFNLRLLTHRQENDTNIEESIKQSLNCNNFIPVTLRDIRDFWLLSSLKCDFPGYNIYRRIHSFYIKLNHLQIALNKIEAYDLTFYILQNSTNPSMIQQLNKVNYKLLLTELNDLESQIKHALYEVYDQYTVSEWTMTYVTPIRLRLQAIINMLRMLSKKKVWPRSPPENDLLVKNMFNKICGNNETLGCTFFNNQVY